MTELPLRELVPAVIGVLLRRGADFASAEDAVQEALVRALEAWPDDPPRDPKAWLVTVAWHKFLDAARSEASRRGREVAAEAAPPTGAVPRWTTRCSCTTCARTRPCRGALLSR